MIIQLGALFGNLISGIGTAAGGLFSAAAPSLLNVGQQFLQREIQRKLGTSQRRIIQGQAVQALNTPGIAVARLGGTVQAVGGRTQRSTFTPAALTPAQSPFGNVPLLPVGFGARGTFGLGFPAPMFGGRLHTPPGSVTPKEGRAMANGLGNVVRDVGVAGVSLSTGPRFAQDQFGKTIMFVPLPDGTGFVSVQQARAMNLNPTRPFWRWNRLARQYEKVKPRRLNPFNFKATARAGRRVERSLDAVKELVRIQKKMTTGKISLKKRKKRKC